jgi:beta-lactamase regulating signal transducer with metallopeptidase domain
MEESNQFTNFETNKKLPNATAVLILGISSIVTCCCYGILSVIIGIIGLVLANKDAQIYAENPTAYSNYNNLKTGKILCIIGIILGVLSIAYFIFIFSYFGMEALQNPELMQERIRELSGQ